MIMCGVIASLLIYSLFLACKSESSLPTDVWGAGGNIDEIHDLINGRSDKDGNIRV